MGGEDNGVRADRVEILSKSSSSEENSSEASDDDGEAVEDIPQGISLPHVTCVQAQKQLSLWTLLQVLQERSETVGAGIGPMKALLQVHSTLSKG